MRTKEYRRVAGWIAALFVSLALADRAEAQNLRIDKPRYTLTLSSQWEAVAVPEGQNADSNLAILSKLGGIGGIAYVTCEPSTIEPNLDALAASFSELLGGGITTDSAGSMVLGKYSVKWQDFKYDSLPVLADMVEERMGVRPNLKNGKFRAYYLVSDGYVFTMAGLRLLTQGMLPYSDIESAIATLVLKPQSGAVYPVVRQLAGGLWSRNGELSGNWLDVHPVIAVDCFSLSGKFIGSARPDGASTWILPSRTEALVVVVRSRDGQSLSLIVRP